MYGGLPSGSVGGIIVVLVWGGLAIGVARLFEHYRFNNWMGWMLLLSLVASPIPPLIILVCALAIRGARVR